MAIYTNGDKDRKFVYISVDEGWTFKRYLTSQTDFQKLMWKHITQWLYPLDEMTQAGCSRGIIIRDAKYMNQIGEYYVHHSDEIKDIWRLICEMWKDIEEKC